MYPPCTRLRWRPVSSAVFLVRLQEARKAGPAGSRYSRSHWLKMTHCMVLLVELGESLHLIGPQRSQSLAASEGAHAPLLAVATVSVSGRGGSRIGVSLRLWDTVSAPPTVLGSKLQPLPINTYPGGLSYSSPCPCSSTHPEARTTWVNLIFLPLRLTMEAFTL